MTKIRYGVLDGTRGFGLLPISECPILLNKGEMSTLLTQVGHDRQAGINLTWLGTRRVLCTGSSSKVSGSGRLLSVQGPLPSPALATCFSDHDYLSKIFRANTCRSIPLQPSRGLETYIYVEHKLKNSFRHHYYRQTTSV